jgi:hypothetical protein
MAGPDVRKKAMVLNNPRADKEHEVSSTQESIRLVPRLSDELEKEQPELYYLSLRCESFEHEGQDYKDVKLRLFRQNEQKIDRALAQQLVASYEVDGYTQEYFGREMFLDWEADAITDWFRDTKLPWKAEVERSRVEFPLDQPYASNAQFVEMLIWGERARWFDDCPIPLGAWYTVDGGESEGGPGDGAADKIWAIVGTIGMGGGAGETPAPQPKREDPMGWRFRM